MVGPVPPEGVASEKRVKAVEPSATPWMVVPVDQPSPVW